MRVQDFITVLSKDEDDDDEQSFELPDGTMFTRHGKGASSVAKPKLDQVTALRFIQASYRILGKFILGGVITTAVQAAQIDGYIAHIAQLGKKKGLVQHCQT